MNAEPSEPIDKAAVLLRIDEALKEMRARTHQLLDDGLNDGDWYSLLQAEVTALEGLADLLERLPTIDEMFSMLADWLVGHRLLPSEAARV